MKQAGGNFGEEVEERIGADRYDRGNAQSEDQHREQQHAAPHTGHPDEDSNDEANENLQCEHFHGSSPPDYAAAPLTPMNPSRSRCKMISCAASSGESSPVLIVTSASAGTS